MELKSLVKHMNKVLELEPPIPLDNEKGTLAELEALKDDLQAEDYELLNRDACRELLSRDLVPKSAMEVVCKKAGRTFKPEVAEEQPEKKPVKIKKPVKKTEEQPEKKPAKPEPVKEKAPRKMKQESNEELAKRLKEEGKKLQTLTNELRKRYEAKGKAFTDEWLEKRAAIYWKIAG